MFLSDSLFSILHQNIWNKNVPAFFKWVLLISRDAIIWVFFPRALVNSYHYHLFPISKSISFLWYPLSVNILLPITWWKIFCVCATVFGIVPCHRLSEKFSELHLIDLWLLPSEFLQALDKVCNLESHSSLAPFQLCYKETAHKEVCCMVLGHSKIHP